MRAPSREPGTRGTRAQQESQNPHPKKPQGAAPRRSSLLHPPTEKIESKSSRRVKVAHPRADKDAAHSRVG